MFYRQKETATVMRNEEIAPGIFSTVLKCEASKYATPGQFIGVYPGDGAHLLMRPISICETRPEEGTLRIAYRVAGSGTDEFSRLKATDTVDILGNLGNGFPLEKAEGKCAVLMGGGIGIPPMLGLAQALKGDVHTFLGYRDCLTFLSDEFMPHSSVYIASEDGSVGCKGNVLTALSECVNLKPDVIFACGPMPMLRAIKKYAEENNIEAYISLEERMACGVGACLGCVCKTTKKDEHSHVNNTRICTEGPVFDSREVDI